MKTSLALKTLFRTAGKTIFTFLLIAVLTFSLFLQVAEYQATAREFAENVDMYHGTGYVEKTPPTYSGYSMLKYPYYIETDPRVDAVDIPELNEFKYPSLKEEELEAVTALPYVSSTYQRYMTAGRSDFLRFQDDYEIWDINARAVIEATLVGPCQNVTNYQDAAYRLTDCKVLAGDLDINDFTIGDGTTYFVASPVEPGWMPDYIGEDWVPTASDRDGNYDKGGRLVLGWDCIHVKLKNYRYGETAQASWIPGGRYVFVFRFYRVSCERRGLSLYLYDWVSEHFCPSVWDVTAAPENYLEREEYAPLKKLVDITNSDLKTLDVVYTDDMAAIRQVNEGKMVLKEGRWLTRADTESGAKVCMLERRFAEAHRLKVGDMLPIELGDVLFEQMFAQGAVASTEERYADNWTPETFEIVGLYTAPSSFARSKEPNWSYSVNTVFVPLSALPETADTVNWELAPGEFTFRVDNAWDIAPFLEKTAPKIEEMGLTLMFDDGGWMEVYKPYIEAQRVALIRIALLAVVTIMATAFAVYLFISRKRKDYAIMRALGTTKRRSGVSLLLPLMVLAVVSVAVGLAAAMVYIGSMGKLGQPPLGMALLCGLAELLFALLLALGMLRSLSRQSPLALLQGGTNTRAAAQPASQQGNMAQTAVVGPAASPQAAPQRIEPLTQERRRKSRPLRFVLRYIFRHIRRSAVKSLLSVLVAALMLSAVAQLGYMRMSYDRLKTDTLVTAAFNRSITLPKLKQIEEAGLTADLYYERNLEAVVVIAADSYAAKLALTPDIARYTGMPCTITYAEGHGVEDLRVTGKYAVLGKALMEACGLSLGDKVRIAKEAALFQFMTEQMSRAVYEHPGELVTSQTLFILDREYMEQALDDFCDCLTIIGSVETGNTTFDNMIYAPGMEADKRFKYDTILEYAEFHLPDNARAQEMKQIGEELTHKRSGEFSIDIEKLESVERTAALLETLYPIVIALTLVIGAFLCVLIIMQTVKDAAIMRIQGTTKAMTRAMLAVEQILLAVFGVAIGLGVMAAVHRTDFAAIAKPTLRFGGAYLAIAAAASAVSAALATKKNLLELLQTKE